jgi:hypothetical protein
VLDNDRIVAFVVTAEAAGSHPAATKEAGGSDGSCTRPIGDPDTKRFGTCLGVGEVVTSEGDELVVRAAEPGMERASEHSRPGSERPIATLRISGLVFAAPLRNPADGRDELVAVARTDDPQQRTWSVTSYKLEGARLVKTIDSAPLYQLTTASARWIGAELRDLDLYLEIQSRPDAIEVGGLLTTRIADRIRDVVVISPVPVTRRHAKSVLPEPTDAGISAAHQQPGPEQHPHD